MTHQHQAHQHQTASRRRVRRAKGEEKQRPTFEDSAREVGRCQAAEHRAFSLVSPSLLIAGYSSTHNLCGRGPGPVSDQPTGTCSLWPWQHGVAIADQNLAVLHFRAGLAERVSRILAGAVFWCRAGERLCICQHGSRSVSVRIGPGQDWQ